MPASDDGDRDPRGAGSEKSLRERLRDFEARQASEEGKALSEEEQAKRGSALGKALRLSTELVAGVFVGGLIGWFLDRWTGLSPLFLIIFLLLGIAAGIMNAVRAARQM
jgi:ATP synthase protein I